MAQVQGLDRSVLFRESREFPQGACSTKKRKFARLYGGASNSEALDRVAWRYTKTNNVPATILSPNGAR